MSLDPFKITGPTAVQFSGGQTSAYMLWRVLRSNEPHLPRKCVVIFCNTGKERPETLEFVRRCGEEWGADVVWLEFDSDVDGRFKRVNFETASRNGEPFIKLIRWKKFLPNPVARICTQWLKIKAAGWYMRKICGFREYTSMIGLRHDEPHRVHSLAPDPKSTPGEKPFAPLFRAGIEIAQVAEFWSRQPFRLGLKSYQGNCDFCFLKNTAVLVRLIRENPGGIDWWAMVEDMRVGRTPGVGFFRKDRPSVRGLVVLENTAGEVPEPPDAYSVNCRCTD